MRDGGASIVMDMVKILSKIFAICHALWCARRSRLPMRPTWPRVSCMAWQAFMRDG
ncbi:MAG: hypothetical protein GPOALKHO_001030 [Sodalis sp.]|nr:MAG: hypothetical protein GPOALKHO_001030 [Sodalis sp.]